MKSCKTLVVWENSNLQVEEAMASISLARQWIVREAGIQGPQKEWCQWCSEQLARIALITELFLYSEINGRKYLAAASCVNSKTC
jgi:hypothetical protein